LYFFGVDPSEVTEPTFYLLCFHNGCFDEGRVNRFFHNEVLEPPGEIGEILAPGDLFRVYTECLQVLSRELVSKDSLPLRLEYPLIAGEVLE